jgi:SAM-dependent methyltransferase
MTLAAELSAETLQHWPGSDTRTPSRSSPDYLAKAPLAQQLVEAVERRFQGRTGLEILDIGCGEKPYLPFFAAHAKSYRGFDFVPGPLVDDVGAAESLPYDDASFDVALCTQVLEHADDPPAVVREMRRVLRPGGLGLLSTHGVFVFHPDPPPDRDYWRWTHAGLARVFHSAGGWSELDVQAGGEYFTCMCLLLCRLLGWPLGALPQAVRGAVYACLNWAAPALDRRLPESLRVPNPNSLAANYLVVARRGD